MNNDPSHNNISATVVRMDASDVVHGTVFFRELKTHIQEEAEIHGASFNCRAFSNVLREIDAGTVSADLLILKTEDDQIDISGSTIHFPSVLTKWNGATFDHFPAEYYEDFVISKSTREIGNSNDPEITKSKGLGTYFLKSSLGISADRLRKEVPPGMPPRGIIAEYAVDNKPAFPLLQKFGGKETTISDSGIFLVSDCSFQDNSSSFTTFIESLGKQSEHSASAVDVLGNVFAITAEGHDFNEKISVSFTKAISTFTGTPLIRAQITSTGAFDNRFTIKQALSEIFLTAQKELTKREWFNPTHINGSSNNYLDHMIVHACKEPSVVASLYELGAKPRKLGQNTMLPCNVDFRDSRIEELSKTAVLPYTCMRRQISDINSNKRPTSHFFYASEFETVSNG